jgi:hypothetical protein
MTRHATRRRASWHGHPFKEDRMSRGATFYSLLAALKQDEMLGEARRRQRSTDVIRRRRGHTIASRLRRAFRLPRP